MELKKLHMGTMSYATDTMDEITAQLEIAFGKRQGKTCYALPEYNYQYLTYNVLPYRRCTRQDYAAWLGGWKEKGHNVPYQRYRSGSCTLP